MTKRLFRQRHPVVSGFLLLGLLLLFFWGGITFFVQSLNPSSRADIFGAADGVGVVEIEGVIVSSEEVIKDLIELRENQRVKALVLRIDSPGGAVGASQEIFVEVQRTNQLKPVVASMASIAASGGLYASLGAERIVANPGTMTGSMGVILKFPNLEALFDKIGYKSEVVKSGKLKDIGSAGRALTDEERQMLQGLIDNVHEQFVQAVVSSRSLPEEEVRKIADGRIFSGEQAMGLGLVDQLGNFTDAVLLAASLANLGEGLPHLIYPKKQDFSFLKLLTGEKGQSILNGKIIQAPVLAYEWSGVR
jgi:protease-4